MTEDKTSEKSGNTRNKAIRLRKPAPGRSSFGTAKDIRKREMRFSKDPVKQSPGM